MKLPPDRQLLRYCKRIAAVGMFLLFILLFYGITFGWHAYILTFPAPVTDPVSARFPVIVARTTANEDGMGPTQLVFWNEWERLQEQGAASVWVEKGAGEGHQEEIPPGRSMFYTYRITELAPQRYMVDVTVAAPDGNALWMRAQYRVEGSHVIPLTMGKVTDAMMATGIAPMGLVASIFFCWSLRTFLRWHVKHIGGEEEIRELLGQARLTLSLLAGYYLFLAIQRVARLASQHS